MNEDQVRAIAQQIYDMNSTADQFAVGQVAFHTHNDIDSPAITYITLPYGGRITDPGEFLTTVMGSFSGGESSATLSSPWHFSSGEYTTEFSNGDVILVTYTAGSTAITWGTSVTATAAFVGGETSATLTAGWAGNSGVLSTRFSNGDIRDVGYVASSTSISWTGALGSAATTAIKADVLSSAATANLVILGVGATASFLPRGWAFAQAGIGIYTLTHNLNTDFYSVIATSSDSSTLTYPLSSCFKNYFTLTFINPEVGVATSTSFGFVLLAVTNRTNGFPQYQLN